MLASEAGPNEGLHLKLEHGGFCVGSQGGVLFSGREEGAVPGIEQCSQGHMLLSWEDLVPQGH